MPLIVTSDFPSTPNTEVVARIRGATNGPRVAWLAPTGRLRRVRFFMARRAFRTAGIHGLEAIDAASLARAIVRFDVVYLSGGNPLRFREQLVQAGADAVLRDFVNAGGLLVGASGGAMQATANVSLYRLLSDDVESVASTRERFTGLGLVGFELLPHVNRHRPEFVEKVRRYSERVPHDIIALEDGAALVPAGGGFEWVGRGEVIRQGYRMGGGEPSVRRPT